MKKLCIIILLLTTTVLFSQEKKKKDRYQFAHTYFGLESEVLPQSSSFQSLNNDGSFSSKQLPTAITNRILIGGTHFWNHADFYISIPVINLSFNDSKGTTFSNGVLTGFKYFPLAIKPKSIRPYVGIGFGGAPFQLKTAAGKGPTQNNRQWYYEGGISYRHSGKKLFEFGTRYFADKEFNYYVSKVHQSRIDLNNFSFLLSYKKLFDFTQGNGRAETKKYIAKAYDALEKENGLSGFSFGIGFSATIPLEEIEYSERTPFLNQETTQNSNIDLGVGYYFHKLDAAARISYRPLRQKETAYGYTSSLKTNALALETFKFIGDYHGFVPFVGPYVGFNNYRLKETDYGETAVDFTQNKLAYGVVFGWDIRITAVDFILLRTNLRYTPDLNYKKDGLSFTNNQLEFNFIQLVYYPERHKITKKL